MTDLLPCPFCGGSAGRNEMDDGSSYIACLRCSATTALHYDRKENLVSSWNDRTPTCGYSCNGVNLHGDKASIDAAFEAFHSHGQIEDLRRNLRHWREECGKLHAKVARCGEPATKYEELFQAVAAYRVYLEKSVNVGPLTNNPSKEAALLRKLWELVPA